MEWLKNIVKDLPLENISEVLAKVVLWWIRLVDGIPEEQLSLYTYVGGSLLVLALLFFALKLVPKFMRGIIWIISAAILLTPASTIGDTTGTAPAIIGATHHLLMGQPNLAMVALLPILAVAIAGLILGAIFQLLIALLTKDKNDDEPITEHENTLKT